MDLGLNLRSFITLCCLITALPVWADGRFDTLHFQLRWQHQFQFAGYYAAVEKGFYAVEGFDVQIHEGHPGINPVDEVLSGRATYGEANSELLNARLNGAPVIAMAAIFQHSPSVLITKKSSGISIPHQLIGKRVMLMDSHSDADFNAMFRLEGIKPDRIQYLPSGFDIQALIDNKTDAFNGYLTNEPFTLLEQDIDYNVIEPSKYGVDFYSDILFTTEYELKLHPARVEAFKRATLRGWRYALANPNEIIDILINKYGCTKSRQHLEYEYRVMKSLIFPDLIEIGHMNPGRWQKMADAFIQVGMAPKDANINGFIYDPLSADRFYNLEKEIYHHYYWALGFSFLLFVMGWGFYKLKRETERRVSAENRNMQIAYQEALKEKLRRTELNRMLGMLGHELRTPLSMIDSTMQSLELLEAGKREEVVTRYQRVRNTIVRLNNIVNMALARERFESDIWKIRPSHWPISDLVYRVITLYGSEKLDLTECKEIRIKLIQENEHGGRELIIRCNRFSKQIKGDLDLIEIALKNLVDNALRYSVLDSAITIDLFSDNKGFWMTIENQVDELPDEDLNRLFEKYYRGNQTTDQEGIGLGLSLVRHIAELHGGRIDITSIDKRIRFIFRF